MMLNVQRAAIVLALVSAHVSAAPAGGQAAAKAARDYPVQPVPFTAVHFDDAFWLPRIEVNRTVTIPFAFKMCEESKRVYHFERAGAVLRGETLTDKEPPGYPFDDTDVYKVIEGAAYTLSVKPDPKLEAYLDTLIAKIAAAQEGDGYLYTTRTIDPQNPHRWAGSERWVREAVDSHELYNLGHLYEAAVAHYQATGKRTLLDVALKTADLLDRTFGPGKKSIWPGHQITEMGLVKLYRVTGDARYLALAKFLLDERGPGPAEGAGRKYNQSQQKVVEQSEAVGHAVRATYMYSGMADVAALTGEKDYVDAMDRIWGNTVGRKLYLTGGIGSTSSGEAFGMDYDLPNLSAYNETCAAIGNDYWNHRLFLLHADARYIDVMERTLYNGLLSGVALDGKSFFYPNPLESAGQHQRSAWFGVACCPGNMTRFLASVPGYAYARQGDTVFVNLFVASTAQIELDGGRKVKIVQETRYPWDGAVRMTVNPESAGRFRLKVRIPGWARGEAVPSDLYRFADVSSQKATLRVNGQAVPIVLEKGFAKLDRSWKAGDVVELGLPMPVRRVAANSAVDADQGRLAFQRGPLVFAIEWPDIPGGKVRNLLVAEKAPLATEFRPGLLNGVQVITGSGMALSLDTEGGVNRRAQDFTAIPYYAWANRGPGEMMVWIPTRETSARPQPLPTLASRATVTSSKAGHNPRAVNDQGEPKSSRDGTDSFFHWWPEKGTTEWVEYTFDKPSRVSETEVYWLDDTGSGECRVPVSWRVLYKEGDDWKPVETAGPFGVDKDRYNKVAFKPVTTSGLRLEVVQPKEWASGIQEWKVR
jgi:DUF1680 family protein